MKAISTKKVVTIWGTSNAWSLLPDPNKNEPSTECEAYLEIQGNEKDGYHLVMSPNGFFTADNWYETKKEAIDSAEELFGVKESEWS